MEREKPEKVIGEHLSAGERLLWCGQPAQGIWLRPYDVFFIPFSVAWGSFAIAWEAMALGIAPPGWGGGGPPGAMAILAPLFGVPFVIVGLYLMFGRFLLEVRQRARTFYGITEKRIIIVSGVFSRKTRSLDLQTLSDLSMEERKDGCGTITFGPTHPFAALYRMTPWPGVHHHVSSSFDLVRDVRAVYELIREAQSQA